MGPGELRIVQRMAGVVQMPGLMCDAVRIAKGSHEQVPAALLQVVTRELRLSVHPFDQPIPELREVFSRAVAIAAGYFQSAQSLLRPATADRFIARWGIPDRVPQSLI